MVDHTLGVTSLSVFAACLLGWGLVAARMDRWHVTAPMAFVVLGLMVTHGPLGFVHLSLHSSTIRTLAEIALALVLFSDASRVNVRALAADAVPSEHLARCLNYRGQLRPPAAHGRDEVRVGRSSQPLQSSKSADHSSTTLAGVGVRWLAHVSGTR